MCATVAKLKVREERYRVDCCLSLKAHWTLTVPDWDYVQMFDSRSFHVIKIWKNALAPCLGKAKAGLKVTYKKLRVERSMNFIAAHESAQG